MEVFKDNVIMPFNYNMLHFLSYSNKINSVALAIQFGTPYISDCFHNSPLMIAMARHSNKLVANMVQNAIESEEMLKRISSYELC
jgi:hypothetical protein